MTFYLAIESLFNNCFSIKQLIFYLTIDFLSNNLKGIAGEDDDGKRLGLEARACA